MNFDKMKKAELAALVKEFQGKLSRLEHIEKKHGETEDKLRESQKMYELLAKNVNDVIWTMDLELHYTYISPSVERMRGYTPEEAINQKLDEIFLPEACATIRETFKEELELLKSDSIRGYRSRALEVQLKRKDGSVVWVEINAAFIPGKDNRPIGVLGITRDIHRRKQAEAEKLKLMHKQQILLENVPALIFLKDTDMRYTAVNRAYLNMLPDWVQDPVGKRDRDLFPDKLAERFEKEDRLVLEEGKIITKEEPVRLRNGDVRDMSVTVAPVHTNDDRITGLVGIAYDITERKQAEEKLKHYTAELERTNTELERLMEEVRSLSLVDELTGLYNRRGFLTLAEQQLKIADRTGRGLSMFFFDLDGMKIINDTLGHAEGDNALRETAKVLRQTFRESDIIARIGGDEFVVMAIESPEGGFETFVIRLKQHLKELNACVDKPFKLSLSMGVAHYDSKVPCSIENLLESADNLMYEEKKAKQKS